MARGDGIDRTNVRNMRLTAAKIMNTQRHNEREKDSYVNQDIVPEMSQYNVHFKKPSGSYAEMFECMEQEKIISTRGLKEDAFKFGELIFDVNSAYFYNHGGYEFAKQFYTEAYKKAIEIVGGEQYILSAVMHADERNRAISKQIGEDVFHYHLHVVYVPVVEKQVLWTKRCKDKSLVGMVKETIMQVSMSKKWASQPAVDEVSGKPLKTKNGKPVLKKSYSILQDEFFQAMQKAGYTDLQRGERGSSEEHLTVTQFKVEQEQKRLQQAQELTVAHRAAAEEYRKRAADMERKSRQAQKKLDEIAPKVDDFERWAQQFSGELETVLPEVKGLESAKSYRDRKAKPLLAKLIDVLKALYRELLDAKWRLSQLSKQYDSVASEKDFLARQLEKDKTEILALRKDSRDLQAVKQVLGAQNVETAIKKGVEKERTNRAKIGRVS